MIFIRRFSSVSSKQGGGELSTIMGSNVKTHINLNLASSDFQKRNFIKEDLKNVRLEFLKYDRKGNPKQGITYYDSFGVDSKANIKEIRQNYLMIVKYYHPDNRPELLVRRTLLI